MKSLIYYAILITLFISCKGNNNVPAKEQASEIKEQTSKEEDKAAPKVYVLTGFKIPEFVKKSGAKILGLGKSLQEVYKILGEPEKKGETEMSEADGEHYQELDYSSKGVLLRVRGDADKMKEVAFIKFFKPCEFVLERGIGIGSSYADAHKAYKQFIDPESDLSEKEFLVLGSIYDGVILEFADGVVESVAIGSFAE